jgi:hypothetical protein
MRLEEFINLVSQLNSQPLHERDPDKMLAELLDRVERYSVSPDGYKVPLEIRYKNHTRRLYVVVTIDKERKLLLLDWRYMKPEDHEIMRQKAYEEKRKVEKKSIEKYIRIYFKLKR